MFDPYRLPCDDGLSVGIAWRAGSCGLAAGAVPACEGAALSVPGTGVSGPLCGVGTWAEDGCSRGSGACGLGSREPGCDPPLRDGDPNREPARLGWIAYG